MTQQITASYDVASFDLAGRRSEPPLAARDAIPRQERPTFGEIAPNESTELINHQFQHPPLYYILVAGGVTAMTAFVPGGGSWSYDQMVVAMRLVSVLLVAPLPLLCFLAGRRLRLRRTVAVAAAVFPLALPQFTHIGSTINNDSLLVAAVSVLTVVLVHVATGDVRLRTGLSVGAAAAVALLAKGLALFLPVMVIAAYAIAAKHFGVRRILIPAAAAAVTALTGGWWWIANLFRYGTVQPTGPPLHPPPAGFTPDFLAWLGSAATLLPQRWWGSFGWYQVSLPWSVVWTATAIVAAGAVVAVTVGPDHALSGGTALQRRRNTAAPIPTSRQHLGLLLIPLAGILAIVVYGAYGYHVATGITPGLQGRYLFPGVVGLAVVTALGWGALIRKSDRLLPLAVLLGATALQLLSIVLILFRFYGTSDESAPSAAIAGFLAWAPWSTGAIVIIAIMTVAAGASAALLLTRRAGISERTDDPDPTAPKTEEAGGYARTRSTPHAPPADSAR